LAGNAGCTQDTDLNVQKEIETFYQEPPADVDILWVVDNSPSMKEEQKEVGARFADFIGHLEETNIDFHIGVITTDMDQKNVDRAQLLGDPQVITKDLKDYEQIFNERIQVGIKGSDMERGIQAAYEALSEPRVSEVNYGFLRRDATLSIIFVSDENDCSDDGALPEASDGMSCYDNSDMLVSVRDYVADFRELKEDPSMVLASAIVGPSIIDDCEDTVPGTRYISIAENMGGIQGNICDEDFSDIMDEMGLSVSGVRSSFQLSNNPKEGTLQVFVGEDEEDTGSWDAVIEDEVDGWTFDDETLYLTFHGASVPPRGTIITVKYEFGSEA